MQLFLAILSFSGTVYFSRAIFYSHLFLIGYCQLLPICKAYCTYFKMENATILCFKGNIFSLSITRYFVVICLSLVHLLFRNRLLWSSSIFTSLKQLHFCNKYFLRTPSCQEQLRLSNNYFLLTSTFLTINTLSTQLLLSRSYFFRIINYSKHVFLRSWQFFGAATFSEEILF